MKIFILNSGSSSLKFQLIDMPSENVITKGLVERIGLNDSIVEIEYGNNDSFKIVFDISNHDIAIQFILDKLIDLNIINSYDDIDASGHRVVQGGERFKVSEIIDEKELQEVIELAKLAPLHNIPNAKGMEVLKKLLPSKKQVAVFDTSFHQTIEEVNFIYGTPYEWYEKYGVRKYGAHGTSHKYVYELAKDRLDFDNDSKVIVCHLGNGSSLCAIRDGKSVDTTMGLTPLAGLLMGTRSGTIDPSILSYVGKIENLNSEELNEILNKKSGLFGLSGISSDMRDITGSMETNKRSKLAFDKFILRICEEILSMTVKLEGLDYILFTAGIGENSSIVREAVCNRLKYFGVDIDKSENEKRGFNVITKKDSKIIACAIPTNEELAIARDTFNLVK